MSSAPQVTAIPPVNMVHGSKMILAKYWHSNQGELNTVRFSSILISEPAGILSEKYSP